MTGSGFATKAQTTGNWDIINFNTDFLLDTFLSVETPSNSASGVFTNITPGVSENVSGFRVDRDAGSGTDDIGFDVENAILLNSRDEYTFTMTATLDANDLSQSDLIVGIHVEDSGSGGDEIFGTTTLNVLTIPEPGSSIPVVVAAPGFATIRRRG